MATTAAGSSGIMFGPESKPGDFSSRRKAAPITRAPLARKVSTSTAAPLPPEDPPGEGAVELLLELTVTCADPVPLESASDTAVTVAMKVDETIDGAVYSPAAIERAPQPAALAYSASDSG